MKLYQILLTSLFSGILTAADFDWAAEFRAKYLYRENESIITFNGQSGIYQRSRLTFRMSESKISGLMQFQDTRQLSARYNNTGTTSSKTSEYFGLHQVYMSIDQLLYPGFRFDIGRFEQNLGNQRLFSSNNWDDFGRSFDGWRLKRSGQKYLIGEIFNLYSTDTYLDSTDQHINTAVYGFYIKPLGSAKFVPNSTLEFYGYNNGFSNDSTFHRTTFGSRIAIKILFLEFELEGSRQIGEFEDNDINGTMAVFNMAMNTSFIPIVNRIAFGREYFSGDDPDTPELEGFANPYGTGHKFHGHFDQFTNFRDNSGTGLHEWNLKLDIALRPGMITKVAYHSFYEGTDSDGKLGEEWNLEYIQKIGKSGFITAGYARHRYGSASLKSGTSDIAYTVLAIRI